MPLTGVPLIDTPSWNVSATGSISRAVPIHFTSRTAPHMTAHSASALTAASARRIYSLRLRFLSRLSLRLTRRPLACPDAEARVRSEAYRLPVVRPSFEERYPPEVPPWEARPSGVRLPAVRYDAALSSAFFSRLS